MSRRYASVIALSALVLAAMSVADVYGEHIAFAQAPADDGWDDEGDDDWGDDEEAEPKPSEPAPAKPDEKKDEKKDDDGWDEEGDSQPQPAQPTEPAPAQPDEGGDDDWGDDEAEPKPSEPAPAQPDEGGDDGWGDDEAAEPTPSEPTPAEPDETGGDDWGDDEPTSPAPKPSGDSGGDDWGDEQDAAPAEAKPTDAGGDDWGDEGAEGGETPAEAVPAPAPPPPPPEPEFPPMPTPPPGLNAGAKLAFTAGALIDRGEFSAAEAKASLASVTPGGEVEGQIQLARLRLRQGRMREAVQAARAAVGAGEQNASARLILLRLMATQGDSVDAEVTSIERLTQRFPDDLGLAIALGESQLIAKQNAAAMKTARAVLKRAETSVTAMKILARAYYATGNDSTAQSILERAVGIEEDAEACHLMSQVFLKRKNVVQARIWLDRAIAANPFYIEALNNLGVAFIQMRDFNAALGVLPTVTKIAPGFGPAWLNLGIAQRGVKRFVDAEKSWKEVLKVDPRMSDAWFNLGVLYLENEMPGLAKEARMNQAIDAFNRYRHGARMRGEVDKSIDTYIAEAKRLIDQEKKAKEKALKKPSSGDDDWGDDSGGGGDDDWGDDSGGGGDDDWGDDSGGGGDDDWGDDSGGDDDW